MVTIGDRIKQLMSQQRLSTKELSQAAGIPVSTISQWILYKQTPKPDALLKVARALGVSMEYLVSGEPPEISIAQNIIESLEQRFVDLHDGIYRVRIQKQISVQPKPVTKPDPKGNK